MRYTRYEVCTSLRGPPPVVAALLLQTSSTPPPPAVRSSSCVSLLEAPNVAVSTIRRPSQTLEYPRSVGDLTRALHLEGRTPLTTRHFVRNSFPPSRVGQNDRPGQESPSLRVFFIS